jgi:formate-dependent nitrite reductase membrane component NrfD
MTADGRFIDTEIATLEGEASHQRPPAEAPALTKVPPPIKGPVWVWSIPTYFFVGGIGGAAMTMGMAAQVFGSRGMGRFDQRCRWTGAVAGGLGSALLIYDLGRKTRFLNMLRVFRPTSPMSVGSWVLALATPLSLASAVLPVCSLSYAAGVGSGLLGIPLATYTGVLIGNTVVPLWSATRRSLPILFAASAVASMASLFELMPLDARERRIVHRFGTIGRVAEIAAAAELEREAHAVPGAARPLRDGFSGTLWNAATVCAVAGLVVSAIPGNHRAKRLATGLLGLVGGAAIRFAIFYGGKRSVRGFSPTVAESD